MKRMSKREMEFRFGMIDEARVRIDRIERGHAVAVLEGVECRLDLGRSERRDIAKPGAIRVRLSSYPKRIGDGSPPRGAKPGEDPWEGFPIRPRDRQVHLNSRGLALEWDPEPYETFARRHPVGSIVEAEVVAVSRRHIRLRFEGDLQSRASTGDHWDRWPHRRRVDRMSDHVPDRVEVIVRRLDPRRNIINVSMHGYPRDGKYCNAAAGYRSAYDAEEGIFRLLPWERNALQ